MNDKAENNLSELLQAVDSLAVVTDRGPQALGVRSQLALLWDKVHGIFSPKTQAILGAAAAAKIVNQDSYDEAVNLLKAIKGTQLDFARFKNIPDRLHSLWKENLAEWQKEGNALTDAEVTLKNKILAFDRKKQQEEDAKKAKADAEARAKAQKEADERAAAAKKAGASKAEVQEIKQAPIYIPPPEVKPTLERDAAAKTLENWQAVTPRDSKGNLIESELAKLLAYIVTGKEDSKIAHPEFLCIVELNEGTLRKLAKAQKKALKLPAIRVEDKGSLRASAF